MRLLLWLLARPSPAGAEAGGVLLALAAVLAFELLVLAWLLRYRFRLWKQALALSNAATIGVIAALGALLLAAGLLPGA